MEDREGSKVIETPARPAVPAETKSPAAPDLDWSNVMALAWRPAWSIRNRRGAWAALRSWLRIGDPTA